ncbi:hypothetical protein Bbelb_405450 [Branchiostoma belcheri]|nr:hypothetical protein Bbelb_405450 [Branchiostoma belcheri]
MTRNCRTPFEDSPRSIEHNRSHRGDSRKIQGLVNIFICSPYHVPTPNSNTYTEQQTNPSSRSRETAADRNVSNNSKTSSRKDVSFPGAAVGMAAGTTVRFGALTDVPEDSSALRLAVEYVNENDLVPNVTLAYTDIYNSTQTLAFFDMIRQGYPGHFYAATNADNRITDNRHTQFQVKATSPVSSGLSLPQLAPDATDPTLDNPLHFPMLLRMSWPDSVLGVTLVDLVEHFSWDHVSIFASNDDYGTHGLVDFKVIAGQKGWCSGTHGLVDFQLIAGQKGWSVGTHGLVDFQLIAGQKGWSVGTHGLVDFQLIAGQKGWSVGKGVKSAIAVCFWSVGTHGLVDFQLIAGQKGWSVHTMQSFDPTEDAADIDVTTQLQVIKSTGARIVVLHCLAPYARQILQESVSLGMTGAGWAWVVSDGVTGLHDASGGNGTVPEYLRGLHDASGGNGTVPEYLRGLVGPRPPAGNGSHGEAFLLKWSSADPAVYPGAGTDAIGPYTARWADAVLALAAALRNATELQNGTITPQPLDCACAGGPSQQWSDGQTMLQYLKQKTERYPSGCRQFTGTHLLRQRPDEQNKARAGPARATSPTGTAAQLGPKLNQATVVAMQVDTGGVTGRVRFTPTGARADAEYDIVNLREDGWQSAKRIQHGVFRIARGIGPTAGRIGRRHPTRVRAGTEGDAEYPVGWWDQAGGLTLLPAADVRFMGGAAEVEPFVSDLRGRHLRVVTVAAPGFVEVSDEDREGNLLAWLSAELGFTYELYEVADGEYGRYKQENASWTGMVGDVVAGTADMAAAIVSITSQRQDVGDFTLPFYSNGITLAMRKSQPSKSNWGFVKPFEGRLWATILLTALAVAVFQGVANFLTRKRDPETKAYVNPGRRFIWRDSGFWEHAWQSWVLLVQFSPDFLPRSLSGRTVTFFWGIGVLVAVSTYTANLAAFLTVSSAAPSISSPEDLLTQSEIAYGAVETYASGEQFLTTSTEPYHSLGIAMWVNRESVLVQSVAEGLAKARDENYALFTDSAELDYAVAMWVNRESVLVQSVAEGLAKARDENYALFTDSTELDYAVSRKPCDLKTVGRLFWQTGFGFFLPKDSPYVVEFNRAILRAEEEGVTGELDHKWIKSQECDGSDQSRLGSGVIGLEDMLGWIKSQECDSSDQSRLGSGVIGLEDMLGW